MLQKHMLDGAILFSAQQLPESPDDLLDLESLLK